MVTVTKNRNHLVATIGSQKILYRDVPADAWYSPYVWYVLEERIAEGYKNDTGVPTGEFGVASP